MKTDAATFRRLLPGLQYMARFPTAKLEVVCERYGWPAAEVRTAIEDMVGSVPRWDEEMLSEFAGKLRIKVPPYTPPQFVPKLPDERPRQGRSPAAAASVEAPWPRRAPDPRTQDLPPAPVAAAAPRVAAPVRPWESVKRPQRATVERYWPILAEIAARPEASPTSIAARHGVMPSTFSAFRRAWWVGLEINAENLGEFRRWAAARWEGVQFSEASPGSATSEPVRQAAPVSTFEAKFAVSAPTPAADTLDATLEELAALAVAYRKNRRRGWPYATLRRTLIGVCSEVVELAVPGGVRLVAGEGARG